MELHRIFRFWAGYDAMETIQWCTQPDSVFGFCSENRIYCFGYKLTNLEFGSQSLCGNYLTTPMNKGMIFQFLFQLLSSRIRTDGSFSQKCSGNVFDSNEKKMERNENSSLRIRRVAIPFLCFTLLHWFSFHFTPFLWTRTHDRLHHQHQISKDDWM